MGLQDQDGFRDAQREREKQRQMDATRQKFAQFTREGSCNAPKPRRFQPGQTGLIPMMVFWCVVMALLYAGMTYVLKPKTPQVLANGDLAIPRGRDGHFYVAGQVNGQAVTFMVDTGASLVSVSEALAQAASLHGGSPTTFHTANGSHPGRVVEGADVTVGPLRVTKVRVGVGLRMGDDTQALLGQSFLSKFNLSISQDTLVLRAR
ncbi:MAG: TIGR02281 family clan AA aspartic protease [Rhodoferax sp.]